MGGLYFVQILGAGMSALDDFYGGDLKKNIDFLMVKMVALCQFHEFLHGGPCD